MCLEASARVEEVESCSARGKNDLPGDGCVFGKNLRCYYILADIFIVKKKESLWPAKASLHLNFADDRQLFRPL